jgi:hypothetical protein
MLLSHLVAQALRERTPPRYFMMEWYGPDGEIVEAWESHPLDPDWDGAHTLVISGTDYAEPRTDWRERGVIPPKGFHRSQWREA